jgi:pyruvate,water dikinase
MDSDIVWLHETGKGSRAIVGGKGASLIALMHMNFPAPPGFCVTTNVYRQMFGDHDELNESLERIRYANLERISELEEIAKLAQRTIMGEPLPQGLEEKILAAYNRLGDGFGEKILVAVRSSATAEDLPSASFAGQHESFLNVCGDNDLILHLRKCWASLWTARAISYRHDRGINHAEVLMAVIVQKMIAFDVAGVLFTEDPVDGKEDRVLIQAAPGLGEAVVSGDTPVDKYVVDKDTGDIITKKTAEKIIRETTVNGNFAETQVPDEGGNLQCLPDAQIQKLAEIGKKIEQSLGLSQDVEWGILEKAIYILQSRPTTSLDRRMQEIIEKEKQMLRKSAPKAVWSDMMVSEIVSYPKPLSSEMIKEFLSQKGALGIFYEKELALGRPFSDPVLYFICGRPYFNRTELIKPYAFMGLPLLPFDKQKARKDPAVANSPYPHLDFSFWGLKFVLYIFKVLLLLPYSVYKLLTRFYWIKNLADRYHKEFTDSILPNYLAHIDELEKTPLKDLNDTELMSRIRLLLDNLARVSTLSHLRCEFLAELGFYVLKRMLGEKANILIGGIEGDKNLETNTELWKTVQAASPQVLDLLLTTPLDEVEAKLSTLESGKHFLQKLDTFLDHYGHRAHNEFELADARWKEDHGFVLEIIRAYVKAKQMNPFENFKALKKNREDVHRKIHEDLNTGFLNKILPLRSKIFSFALNLAQIYTPLRESTKFYYLLEVEQLRRHLLELGARLASNRYGCLNNKNDIFFLFSNELQEIVQKKRSSRQIKDLIAERKRDYLVKKRIPVPSVIFRDSLESIGKEPETEAAEVLSGTGVSKGKVTGIARIIKHPSQIRTLNYGEILVAPTTDPGWTPVFFIVSALVMDTGNALSHGAVLAREYGLPAVVNVPRASEIIEDGRKITVDVDQNKVYLH